MNEQAVGQMIIEALTRERIDWFLKLKPFDQSGRPDVPTLEASETYDRPYLTGVGTNSAGELHRMMLGHRRVIERVDPDSPDVRLLETFIKELTALPLEANVAMASLMRKGLECVGTAYVDIEDGRLLCALRNKTES